MQFLDILCIAATATLAAAGTASAQTPATTAAPAPTTLSVTFTGIDAKQGRIMLALYDEAGWQGGKPVRAEMIDATADTVTLTLTLTGLPAGRYGIKAFHDVDSDGKMDANPFGMPTEPFAFSNDARGAMGPARWADAAFTIAAGANAQTITIR